MSNKSGFSTFTSVATSHYSEIDICEREGRGRKRKRNESEETEETKNISPLLLPATRTAGLVHCKPISVGRPSDVR